MDPEHETPVEKAYNVDEKDTWWNLFRLLIPSIQWLDENTLKAQYWPCKPQTPPCRDGKTSAGFR